LLDVTECGTTDMIPFAPGTGFSGTTFALGSGLLGGTAVAPVGSGGSVVLLPNDS